MVRSRSIGAQHTAQSGDGHEQPIVFGRRHWRRRVLGVDRRLAPMRVCCGGVSDGQEKTRSIALVLVRDGAARLARIAAGGTSNSTPATVIGIAGASERAARSARSAIA